MGEMERTKNRHLTWKVDFAQRCSQSTHLNLEYLGRSGLLKDFLQLTLTSLMLPLCLETSLKLAKKSTSLSTSTNNTLTAMSLKRFNVIEF
jgi:hypothetical protein